MYFNNDNFCGVALHKLWFMMVSLMFGSRCWISEWKSS